MERSSPYLSSYLAVNSLITCYRVVHLRQVASSREVVLEGAQSQFATGLRLRTAPLRRTDHHRYGDRLRREDTDVQKAVDTTITGRDLLLAQDRQGEIDRGAILRVLPVDLRRRGGGT